MKLVPYLLGATLAALIGGSSASFAGIDKKPTSSFVQGRYIVEFANNDVATPAENLVKLLEKQFQDLILKVTGSYSHELFNGISLQVQRASSSGDLASTFSESVVKSILDQTHVANVYRVSIVPRPNTSPRILSSSDSEAINTTLLLPHAMTQVDRVHSELKNTGEGIVVGIIDTGVDYYHPALGGGFGPGYKVRYGRDLVGNNYNADNGNIIAVPGPTPLDDCGAASGASGHGTHVSGIIAGKASNFTGVAPDATLGMWRVFGCTGSTSDDIIIQAMLEAYDTGVDIISMSLGDTSGWSESASAVVAERIVKQGVPVVIAAGNSGASGALTVGSPSTGHGATSVASFDNNYQLAKQFTATGIDGEFTYQLGTPDPGDIPDGELAAGDKNLGSIQDACDESNIPSGVKGKLALVQRGTCTFTDKATNAAKAGAIGLVVYNNDGDSFAPSTPGAPIPVVGIGHDVGVKLAGALQGGKTVKLTFQKTDKIVPITTGNTVSDFSSVGPSYENDMKPDIAGVGGNIYSTLPRYLGSWGFMSGTSMATPYVSGSFALYLKSLNGRKAKPAFITEQFQNYAYKAPHAKGESYIDSPLRQGAGLVQVYDAITETVHISPGGISFNDTATSLYKTHTLTVTNYGDSIASYEITNNVSVSVVPYDIPSSGYMFTEPATFGNHTAAKLRISKSIIKVSPGRSANVVVTVIPPDTDPSLHIMYGGYIQFKSRSNGAKDLMVPYFGIVGQQKELPIFNEPPFVTDPKMETVYNKTSDTYVFDRLDNNTTPYIVYSLATPTAHVVAELLSDNTEKTIGYAFRGFDWTARNTLSTPYSSLPWHGTYSPAWIDLPVEIPVLPGTYRIRFKALKLLGNPEKSSDWEVWESCRINVK